MRINPLGCDILEIEISISFEEVKRYMVNRLPRQLSE